MEIIVNDLHQQQYNEDSSSSSSEHFKSVYLTDLESKCLVEQLNESDCRILSAVFVEIYSLGEFIWERRETGYALITHNSASSFNFYFFNTNFELKWKTNATEVGVYSQLTHYFHYFTTKRHTVGINFPREDEARAVYELILDKIPALFKSAIKLTENEKCLVSRVDCNNNNKQVPPVPAPRSKQPPVIKSVLRRSKGKIKKDEISAPTNFRVVQHIGLKSRNKLEICLNEENNESLAMKEMMLKITIGASLIQRTASDLRSMFIKRETTRTTSQKSTLPPAPAQYKLAIRRNRSDDQDSIVNQQSLSPRLSDFFQNDDAAAEMSTSSLTIDQLQHIVTRHISESDFEKTKLSELFQTYLPRYKHSDDWISAFSISELRLLMTKVDDETFYGTKLESIKLLITEEQNNDFQEAIQLAADKKTKQNADDRYCKICFENPMDCVYFDCKHMCSCMQCSEKIQNCPICRNPIKERVKIIVT